MDKKRVVAYVRVSSASSAQIHSYEFQEKYWHDKFENDPENELVRIYADRGISGSNAYKRPEFMAMLQDAEAGMFDVVHTKSVSRFARNTVQLLDAVRKLRDLGIEVVFEKEQISTLQPTTELFLTIAASIAENDLEVYSKRQKWSIQHRFENGWYSIGTGMYGYRMTSDNRIVIAQDEADVVRWIYEMYLSGCGSPTIAKTLNEAGIPNVKGLPWTPKSILRLIDNEKYMGDAMMGKSVNIEGVKRSNMDGRYGERFYIEDAHEGIISKETYYLAQSFRKKQSNHKLVKRGEIIHPFTGMIECGCCGSHYRHKVNNSGTKWESGLWSCAKREREGKDKCDSTRINDTVLQEKFVQAYNEFITQRPQSEIVGEIQDAIHRLQAEEEGLAKLLMRKLISESSFANEQQEIKKKIREQKDLIHQFQVRIKEREYTKISEFNEEKLKRFIEKIIMGKNLVTFRFFNEVEITLEYTNGQPGNKPGWNKKES